MLLVTLSEKQEVKDPKEAEMVRPRRGREGEAERVRFASSWPPLILTHSASSR